MDLLAGMIVLIVAAGLLVAVVFAMRQCTAQIPAPSIRPSTTTTVPVPTQPPAPTLAKNPFSAGDFAYDEKGYLTCLTGESWLGVDVSEYQGKIQWDQVAHSGVQYAMVRLGYRGWGKAGVIRADSKGLENVDGAAAAGLKVGVYFFSQAISVEEAVEEARFLLEQLDGRELQMPVVFDWEWVYTEGARTADMKRSTLNACALAFCQEIEAAGYETMVYYNQDMARWMFDLLVIQQEGYDFWLALYSDKMDYPYQVRMWQYSCDGNVAGIQTRVDMNLYFPNDGL